MKISDLKSSKTPRPASAGKGQSRRNKTRSSDPAWVSAFGRKRRNRRRTGKRSLASPPWTSARKPDRSASIAFASCQKPLRKRALNSGHLRLAGKLTKLNVEQHREPDLL
jgi:hypothetical protein